MSGIELGTIIAAILTLAGVIYAASRPGASVLSLTAALSSLAKENIRLNAENIRLTKERDDCYESPKVIADLERDKRMLTAGIAILTNQLTAERMTPLWKLPATGPLGKGN